MKVVLSGASGLIGRALSADLASAGITVVRLTRDPAAASGEGSVYWEPARGLLDPQLLAGVDMVVNLNGHNVAASRWTSAVKERLRTSRLDPTDTLVTAIARAEPPPRILANASAIGYYGDRGEEELHEGSSPGTGFLAELTRAWEERALGAQSERTKVVLLRLGVVVGPGGGALARMLPLFRVGLGGPVGSGRQWWSWVAIADVVGVVRFLLEHPTTVGPINVVSPAPIRCHDFVRTLALVVRRPAVLPLPGTVARLALGEMADALLLASAKVSPVQLERLGFGFCAPDLEDALQRALRDSS